ncbi:helix-turn-helix domain-containing protein [Halomonas korlensis]|uniref:HTH cro/C1-type domain-containing protein n=1 Tax=Halomonas korlensis TaxID=463301 RepID=A0A1I7JM61_9GAMM|nr:helix-turn-helix transcriptional regulator [Halomonas korlensis]SFU86275.1 hypothetical protein SAMN04487955_11166 [Halomonas korlensis]
MSEQQAPEPSRALVWERVKKAAQAFHDHHKERGTSKLISHDSELSPQYVSDWKSERSPIPMTTLAKLASLYGVNMGYLAGYTDDPEPRVSKDDAQDGATMVELVELAIKKSDRPVDAGMATTLCSIALSMLRSGESRATILGTLIFEAESQSGHDKPPSNGR